MEPKVMISKRLHRVLMGVVLSTFLFAALSVSVSAEPPKCRPCHSPDSYCKDDGPKWKTGSPNATKRYRYLYIFCDQKESLYQINLTKASISSAPFSKKNPTNAECNSYSQTEGQNTYKKLIMAYKLENPPNYLTCGWAFDGYPNNRYEINMQTSNPPMPMEKTATSLPTELMEVSME